MGSSPLTLLSEESEEQGTERKKERIAAHLGGRVMMDALEER